MTEHRKSPPHFTDNLANLVGGAVSDIRQKLVEEAWFGRATASELPNYYESFWQRHGPPNDHPPEQKDQERDNAIDR